MREVVDKRPWYNVDLFGWEVPTTNEVEDATAAILDEGVDDLVKKITSHDLCSSNRRAFNDRDFYCEIEFGRSSI